MSELGDALRDERRRQGKRLPDIESATHIRGRLIEALEKGEYERLPTAAYVKGYILSYARALDIPAGPLLDAYRRDMEGRAPAPEHRLPFPIPQIDVPRREEVHQIPWRVALVAAVAVVAVILLIWGVGRLFSPSEPAGPLPLPEPVSEATTTVPGVEEGTATPGVNGEDPVQIDAVPAEGTFQVKVVVAQGQASWLVITVDGKEAYKGTLTGGQREYAVSRSVTIAMGRPSAVTVYRDGETVTQAPAVIAQVPTLVLEAD